MRRKDNPITDMFKDFKNVNGRCSLEAVAFTFKLDLHAVKRVMKTTGWREYHEGTNFQQCNSAIKLLADIHLRKAKYYPNKAKLTVRQFVMEHPKGEFLLNQDGHISAIKNGVAYDNWTPTNFDLLGWWEISKKYEIVLCKPKRYRFERSMLATYHLGRLERPKVWKK